MVIKKTVKLVRESKSLTKFCLGVFILGLLCGILTYPLVEEYLFDTIKIVYKDIIIEDSKSATALNIINRNIRATFMEVLLGITIVFTLLILLLNGLFNGYVIRFALENGIPGIKLVYGILPHAFFEMVAFLLSAAFGIRIGLALISSGQRISKVVRAAKEAIFIYVTIIVPLIILAGIIESYVSNSLLLR